MKHLSWLDKNTDEQSDDFRHSIVQLRRIVNNIDMITHVD